MPDGQNTTVNTENNETEAAEIEETATELAEAEITSGEGGQNIEAVNSIEAAISATDV